MSYFLALGGLYQLKNFALGLVCTALAEVAWAIFIYLFICSLVFVNIH